MGSSQSRNRDGQNQQPQRQQQQQQQQFQMLNALLQENPIQWDAVRFSLREAPDQACLYAHHLEPSHLFVALMHPSCPVDAVKQLIEAYEDALDHDFEGQTVLHTACVAHGNAGILELLLSKRPQLVKTVNVKLGTLPLHHCRSVDGAKVLVKAYPEAATQRTRSDGSLPLHCVLLDAISKQPVDAEVALDVELCMLLMNAVASSTHHHNSTGGLLVRNKKGQTPLSLIVRLLDHAMQIADQDKNDEVKETFRHELWDLLITHCLPRLMGQKNVHRGNTLPLELHTLIEHACCHSQTLMDRALQDYADQASERDALGRTPLHIAAHIGSCCSTEALESLIRANPKAPRMTDNEGRLPIDWAAESPHTPFKNLSLLIKGEPRAIDTRDLRDGHYPFVSAAISEHTSVNNTYYLLRAKPHVLSYFHTP